MRPPVPRALSTVHPSLSDATKKRASLRRIEVIRGILLVALLIIIARLLELQILRGKEYEEIARTQHYGGIILPAKRGEILSVSSKTGELSILATNTTLDLLYVDPFITKEPRVVAQVLAETLLTEAFDTACRQGLPTCPREFRTYYAAAFDPAQQGPRLPPSSPSPPPPPLLDLPTREEVQRQVARDIERRISEEFVSFVPLLYGATKVQMQALRNLAIPGLEVLEEQKLIYANPIHIPDYERRRIARLLSPLLGLDQEFLRERLRQRRLRYVPILRQLSPALTREIRKRKQASAEQAAEERQRLRSRGLLREAEAVEDPLRGIALLPEHWRLYPDGTLAAQVVGFLNINQEAQNGIERAFDHELRGQEGRIRTLTDPFGGQIVSDEQTVVQARDGKTAVLTIDRFLQEQVEQMLQRAIEEFEADSGQVIIMDPYTGRILVMANAPLSDSNNYSTVYEKESIEIPPEVEPSIVVEIYHPQTNELVIRSYLNDLTPEGRSRLSRELQQKLTELEKLYNLDDLKRYYLYLGENNRRELFPTGNGAWLKYRNEIGVGAYINRTIQEIYEPGSVFKPITMAVAIDQGEVSPKDTYLDEGPIQVDEYTIQNAENRHFGLVTMTDCLSFSVNTCLTSVSAKLGKKLFQSYIERFGFGRITGVQLDDEKSGHVPDWRRWSDALLATASYGQGISTTPLQVVTAYAALANGGKLVKPTVIDRWIDPSGDAIYLHPQIREQVITEETAATVTAMLVHGMNEGYARRAKVTGYRMAGKTGTSQIARPGGGYEKGGSGTTITSLAGYAPIDHPKFVMLVKFDRPRLEEYGTRSAAPLFRDIAALLFEYYGIPPDESSLSQGKDGGGSAAHG